MTPSQKLEALVERAIGNGWNPLGMSNPGVVSVQSAVAPVQFNELEVYIGSNSRPPVYVCNASAVLFSHDFAKALLGETETELYIEDSETAYNGPQPLLGGTAHYPYHEGAGMTFVFITWRYHLQMAVILDSTDKQIDYMYNVVFGKETQ